MKHEAFKKLIKRYESITLDRIKKVFKIVINKNEDLDKDEALERVANRLTGFGSVEKCTLCKEVEENCSKCSWSILLEFPDKYCCFKSKAKITYDKIEHAQTPKQLLKAFKERAKYMRSVLNNKQGDLVWEWKSS